MRVKITLCLEAWADIPWDEWGEDRKVNLEKKREEGKRYTDKDIFFFFPKGQKKTRYRRKKIQKIGNEDIPRARMGKHMPMYYMFGHVSS